MLHGRPGSQAVRESVAWITFHFEMVDFILKAAALATEVSRSLYLKTLFINKQISIDHEFFARWIGEGWETAEMLWLCGIILYFYYRRLWRLQWCGGTII